VVALGARKSVVAEEEQMRPVEAREFVSRQPQTATGILKQRLHVLRGAASRKKGVLLAECLRAGPRQQPPNEDAHRAAREPVHFNIGIQPLSAQIPPRHAMKSCSRPPGLRGPSRTR